MTARTAIGGGVTAAAGITYLTFAAAAAAYAGVQPSPGGMRTAIVSTIVTGAGLVLAVAGRRLLAEPRGAHGLSAPDPRPDSPEPSLSGVCRNTPPPDLDFE